MDLPNCRAAHRLQRQSVGVISVWLLYKYNSCSGFSGLAPKLKPLNPKAPQQADAERRRADAARKEREEAEEKRQLCS